MGGALAAAALAARLVLGEAIHVPPWPLSPDGDVVALEGSGKLQADGARIEPIGAGLWRVVPGPGERRVRLRAGAAAVEVEVEPPPGRIVIEAMPERLVKGRDLGAELRIAVLDAASRPDPTAAEPVIACSAGAVRGLAIAGPGRFTARYEVPTSRHPEVAVLTAVSPRCPLCATPRAVGAAVLPLAAAIDLPGHTEPHVQVRVTVGDRTFGPVAANDEGSFKVPVVVPPGVRFGEGVSIDKLGNLQSQVIDLRLPPVNQIACAAWPRVLPADGHASAQIWCVATDVTGRPAPRARLELATALGRASRFEAAGGGLFRARYVAPRGGGGRQDRLMASFPSAGPASRQEVSLELATGAPADVGHALEREPVPLGASVAVRSWARDDRGDALPAPSGPPGGKVGFVAPDRFVARSGPGDWTQLAELRVELPLADKAALLWLRQEGGEWVASARGVDMRPAAGVAVRFGSGAVAVTDARGEARIPARGASETVEAANGLRAAGWAGFGLPVPPFAISRTFAIALAPEAPVDVRAAVRKGVLRWRVQDRSGRVLPGRRVQLQGSGVQLGPVEPDGEGGRCTVAGNGTVAVIDAETGVAAVLEVP
jgi:hypothetical protein